MGTPAERPQQPPDVARMILAAGLLLDERPHAANGPQRRGITVRFRSLQQGGLDAFLLAGRQAGPAPSPAGSEQSRFALGLGRPRPTADRLAMHAHPAGGLGLRQSLIKQFEGF